MAKFEVNIYYRSNNEWQKSKRNLSFDTEQEARAFVDEETAKVVSDRTYLRKFDHGLTLHDCYMVDVMTDGNAGWSFYRSKYIVRRAA